MSTFFYKLTGTLNASFVAVLLFTAPVNVSALDEPVPPQMLARINGAPIYNTDLPPIPENRIAKYRQLGYKGSTEQLRKKFLLNDLDSVIARELLAQAGESLQSKDIERRLEKRMADFNANSGEKQLYSKEKNEVIRSKLRKEVLAEDYLQQMGLLDPKVDERELRKFYDNNKASFMAPKSVKARHILFLIPKGATDILEKEIQGKAEMILLELKRGKDFAELARNSSECASKDKGGDLGFIKQGFMPKEFDAVAFLLNPGETSNIVKTSHGLHIIRIEEARPEKVAEFSEVKDFIASYLSTEHKKTKTDELVRSLRKSAKIEILID